MTQPTQTSAVVGQLIAALLTVGTVWGTIRSEVPDMVRAELVPELATMKTEMRDHADSLWTIMADTLVARTEAQARATVDSLAQAVGLVVQQAGRGHHRHATPADTIGSAKLRAQVDTLVRYNRDVLRQLARLTTAVSEQRRPRTSQTGYP